MNTMHSRLALCSALLLAAACSAPHTERRDVLGDAELPGMAHAGTATPSVSTAAARSQAKEGDAQELAKKLSNPVASLISLPLQHNYDKNIGPFNGERWQLNFQPVVPFTLNEDWNLISRTIVPIIDMNEVRSASSDDSGLGDTTQSFFFSPKAPTADGIIWGAGPVFLLPTATDDNLGTEKLSVGPTALALKQADGWTRGVLANQLWSVAGEGSRPDVNSLYVQPFLAYTTHTATTYSLNAEASYDWAADDAAIPLNAMFTQLVRIGEVPVSIGFGLRYWAESQDNGPTGMGFRFIFTPLFPKK
jgi:hypothetical protein